MLKRRNVIQNTAIRKGITYNQEIQNLIDNSGQQLGPGDHSGPRMVDHPEIPVEPGVPQLPVDPFEDLDDAPHSLALSLSGLARTAALLPQLQGSLAERAANPLGPFGIPQTILNLFNAVNNIINATEQATIPLPDITRDSSIRTLITSITSLGVAVRTLSDKALLVDDMIDTITNQFSLSSDDFIILSQSQEFPKSVQSLGVCCQLISQSVKDLPNQSTLSIEDRDIELKATLELALSAQHFAEIATT